MLFLLYNNVQNWAVYYTHSLLTKSILQLQYYHLRTSVFLMERNHFNFILVTVPLYRCSFQEGLALLQHFSSQQGLCLQRQHQRCCSMLLYCGKLFSVKYFKVNHTFYQRKSLRATSSLNQPGGDQRTVNIPFAPDK